MEFGTPARDHPCRRRVLGLLAVEPVFLPAGQRHSAGPLSVHRELGDHGLVLGGGGRGR